MDESLQELQVQLVAYLTALVSLHGLLQACIAYLIIRNNKRRRIDENDRQIRREISKEVTINLDEDVYFGNQETFVPDDPVLQTSTNSTIEQNNSSVKSKSTSRKRKINSDDDLISSLIDSVNNTSRGVQNVVNYFKKLIETNECQGKVYDAIIAVEDLGLDDSQILEAAEIITSSQSTSRLFFQLPMHLKKRVLWRKLGLI